jgi:hypothetical protein
MKVPDNVKQEIEAAFHEADNKVRALPEEWQDEMADAVLLWALRSYLPVSSWFKGLYAYAVHPDEVDENGGWPVKIVPATHSPLAVVESEVVA